MRREQKKRAKIQRDHLIEQSRQLRCNWRKFVVGFCLCKFRCESLSLFVARIRRLCNYVSRYHTETKILIYHFFIYCCSFSVSSRKRRKSNTNTQLVQCWRESKNQTKLRPNIFSDCVTEHQRDNRCIWYTYHVKWKKQTSQFDTVSQNALRSNFQSSFLFFPFYFRFAFFSTIRFVSQSHSSESKRNCECISDARTQVQTISISPKLTFKWNIVCDIFNQNTDKKGLSLPISINLSTV